MDTNDEHDLFSDNDYNIKANDSKSSLNRQTSSGKRRKNGELRPLDLSRSVNAVINVKSQTETLRNFLVNVPQTQVRATSVPLNSKESTIDLDSHSETCVLCSNALVIQDRGRPINVFSYNLALEDCTYQTVSGGIGYDHPNTGQTYHWVIHQSISIPHLEHHLLGPM